eukprot:7380149-Prymnesium_polylepis.1
MAPVLPPAREVPLSHLTPPPSPPGSPQAPTRGVTRPERRLSLGMDLRLDDCGYEVAALSNMSHAEAL